MRGNTYRSVTNVGDNPTVADEAERTVTIETHILDFADDLYGEPIRVAFSERMRGQVKFGSLEKLKNQLAEDVRKARE